MSLSQRPLTDEELATVEALVHHALQTSGDANDENTSKEFARLVAEFRRQRSDEWLIQASREIAKRFRIADGVAWAEMTDILRKHRTGAP